MSKDMISKATRQKFREFLVGSYLREIDDLFDAAGVPCDEAFTPPVTGQRRGRVEQYYNSVDWTDSVQVRRVLGVYESILIEMPNENRATYEQFLLRDGYRFDGSRLVPFHEEVISKAALGRIATALDIEAVNEQVGRLKGAISDDPALALGTAKELVESVCKGVAAECGVLLTGNEDVPLLVKVCLKSLGMAREDIPDEKRGAEARRRIAQGLAAACAGITELRNIYGTGHGRGPEAAKALERDARLAVGAATTLAVFLAEVCIARRGRAIA